jgi:predicted exporter
VTGVSGAPPPAGRRRLVAAAALAVAMAVYCALRLQVTTDITHFLPAGSDHRLAQLSRQLADSALTRTMILSVESPEGSDPAALRRAAAALAERLSHHPEVAWIQRGPTDQLAEAVYALYAPRLAYFFSERPEAEAGAALSDDGLDRAARALKRQLALPLAPLLTRMAGADPLQWFPAILHRLERAQTGGLEVDGDQLVTRDHRHAIIFLGTRHSPFDSGAQAPLLAEIASAFTEVDRQAGGGLRLERGGVAPIALDAEKRIRHDLTQITALSTGGVVLLFLLLFGSLRAVVLALLPIVAGALTATTLGILLFGKVHGMTLAIGSTLIGVAIDYPILLLTHRVLAPAEPPESVVRRIWIGILLGGLTTAAGFAALAWTSFPGVREMAVTSAAGILAALAVTRYVLPPLLGRRVPRAPILWRGSVFTGRAIEWLAGARWFRLALLAAVALVCAVGLPRLRWLDSLAALNAADPGLKAETDSVRARVSSMEEGRFVIATAPDEEQALRINDQVALRLEAAARAGVIEGMVSLHAFVWSADLQRRNRAALAAAPELGRRTLAALQRQGFRPQSFAAFAGAADALGAPPAVAPLRLGDIQGSALAPLVRPFVVKVGDEVGLLTFLRGVKRPAELAADLASLPGALYFDQASFLDETYARFRVQTLQAVGVGLVLILLVLQIRYRRWRSTLGALLPAVLAASTTMAVLGLAGVATNLLHVLSLLMVLSMGADYGIFLIESPETAASGPTFMSLIASCATSILSFGLLALSSTPALRAIGLTTAIGLLLSLLMAPLALVLARAERSRA